MHDDASAFGDLLREFRVRAGLSQSDLAEKANVSEAAIGALERGVRKAPYRSTVALLAKALDLDPQERASFEAARTAARGKSAANVTHNVEAARSSFVGREADVDRVLKLLRRSRLVSVTGSGGVGKTRVALEAARQVFGDPFPEVWFVDLGPVIDGDFIAAKIANSVRPPIGDRADTVSELASALAKRHMLLILDNCEHIVAQAAVAADVILEGCPRISILATSRERLDVAGEFVYRLPSLLLEPAIELFSQRARVADPRFSVDAKSLPAVTDIARRLGGIPLALELTAAQVPQLGLEALREDLHERLSVASGRPDLPARQQTVMATIEWSYDLLTSKERALLCEAAVFAGGFSLAGAEAVCGGVGPDRSHVLPLLSSLTNKSLLNVLSDGDRVRYGLFDSVRSFGLERLRGAGTYDSASRRHARWFAAIADDVQNTVLMLLPERSVELVPDFDDIRAAVAWCLNSSERDDLALAGRILCGLFGLWDFMGRRREHRHWIETTLERIDQERHPLVSAYLFRAFITRTQAEFVALEAIDRAVLLGEKSGDQIALAEVFNVVAQAQATHGLLTEAEFSVTRAHELLVANGMERSTSYCGNLLSRSFIRFMQGRLNDARAYLATAEATALALGHEYVVVRNYYIRRAEIEYVAGDKQAALHHVQRMIDSEFGSDPAVAVNALPRIVVLQLLLGRVESAIPPLRELLGLLRDGYGNFTYIEMEYAALALALLGNSAAAAKLFGALRFREIRLGFRRLPMRTDAWDLLCSTLRGQLGDEAMDRLGAAGDALEPDELIEAALAALGS